METAIVWGLIIAIVLVVRHNLRKENEYTLIEKKYEGKCEQCGSEELTITSKISPNFVHVRCANCSHEFVGHIGELPKIEENYSKPCYNCGNYAMYVYVQNGDKYGICTKCYQKKVLETQVEPRVNTNNGKEPSIAIISEAKATDNATVAAHSKMSKTKTGIVIVVIVCFILWLAGSCNSTSSNRNGREVRCWYCSKVIINSDGRAIHATHTFGNTYVCDYCGKSNVVK